MSLNFSHIKGTTFEAVKFGIDLSGTPIDLSETTIVMKLQKQYGGTIILTLTSVNNAGITITDVENGLFEINEQVIDIPPFKYIYDIWFNINGKTKKYISGRFWIKNNNAEEC